MRYTARPPGCPSAIGRGPWHRPSIDTATGMAITLTITTALTAGADERTCAGHASSLPHHTFWDCQRPSGIRPRSSQDYHGADRLAGRAHSPKLLRLPTLSLPSA